VDQTQDFVHLSQVLFYWATPPGPFSPWAGTSICCWSLALIVLESLDSRTYFSRSSGSQALRLALNHTPGSPACRQLIVGRLSIQNLLSQFTQSLHAFIYFYVSYWFCFSGGHQCNFLWDGGNELKVDEATQAVHSCQNLFSLSSKRYSLWPRVSGEGRDRGLEKVT
jgi:hypothetical protein